MGASSVLGLLFEISADPSGAEAAIAKFNEATGNALADAAGKTKPLDDALLSNRESVRLLSEEVGVHLPRAVSGAIAEMMPGINAIGPALLAAFALKEIPQFIKGIDNASDALGGYISTVKEFEAANVKASNAALIHFKTIAIGEKLIGDTNRALAQLAKEHEGWNEFARVMVEKQTHSWQNLLGPLGTAYSLYKAGSAAIRDQNEARDQEAKLQARLIEQLNQLSNLEGKVHKDATKAAKEEHDAWERQTEEQYEYWQKRLAEDKRAAEEEARAKKEIEKVDEQHVALLREEDIWRSQVTAHIDRETHALENEHHAMEILNHQRDVLFERSKQLRAEYHESHLVMDDFTRSVREQVKAISEEQAASLEGLAAGIAGLIGSRKAQAAVEAVWETAKGIACLAEGTWPPNPAAIIAAGMHFEAAAQYAMLGGGGGGRRSAGGGASEAGSARGGGGAGGFGQGTLHITFINSGNLCTPQTAQQFVQMIAPVFSSAVKSGQITLTASNALINGPKQTGR